MGFIIQNLGNNKAQLIVAFRGTQATKTYTPTNNVSEAINYFNLILQGDTLYQRVQKPTIYNELGLNGKEEIPALRQAIAHLSENLSDEAAVENLVLFKIWEPGLTMKVGERYRYHDILYRVLQQHISQNGWEPNIAHSLFAQVLAPDNPDEIVEWVQPESTNGYPKDTKVSHNNKIWISLVDNNVWEPGIIGSPWEEVKEEEDTITEWEQRDATNPYMIGDKVLFNGQVYESIINNNVWSPTTYPAGWQLIE